MKAAWMFATGAAVSTVLALGYIGVELVSPSVAQAAPEPHAAMPTQQAHPVLASKIENFVLNDQNLTSHELYRLKDASAVVLVSQGNGCPVVRNIALTVKALKASYADKGVEFLMINSNMHDTREQILAEAKDFDYGMPILMDAKQEVGEQLGLTRTATVYVINPKTWDIAYRGPVDDRVTYERQRASATENWAKDAIDAVMAGKKPAVTERDSIGCLINFSARDDAAAHHSEAAPGVIQSMKRLVSR